MSTGGGWGRDGLFGADSFSFNAIGAGDAKVGGADGCCAGGGGVTTGVGVHDVVGEP